MRNHGGGYLKRTRDQSLVGGPSSSGQNTRYLGGGFTQILRLGEEIAM